MKWLVSLLLPILILSGGCNQPPSANRSSQRLGSPEDPVRLVSSGDAKMNTAMATARSTVGEFTAALASPTADQSGFSVKMPVEEGGKTEHMWLADVSYDGKSFHGTINNDPEMVKSVKLGQKVSVDASGISDWMYIEKGVLVGGYTIRVLRDTMSPTERADFDKNVPFEVK
jgi:uncharacterized protein YegJ (DUF2314 family)